MERLRRNWIRLTTVLISAATILAAIAGHDTILSDRVHLDDFSYIGGVATCVGLIIAILEIAHVASVSRSIRDEVAHVVDHGRIVDRATLVIDCLSALDEASNHVTDERYEMSLKCVQYARKNCMRIASIGTIEPDVASRLGKIELGLVLGTHTNASAPLQKRDRVEIQEQILDLKICFEAMNPPMGALHAA
ncbi:MAG: hypothetical protein WBW32_14685 [Luteibacter sp.]